MLEPELMARIQSVKDVESMVAQEDITFRTRCRILRIICPQTEVEERKPAFNDFV